VFGCAPKTTKVTNPNSTAFLLQGKSMCFEAVVCWAVTAASAVQCRLKGDFTSAEPSLGEGTGQHEQFRG